MRRLALPAAAALTLMLVAPLAAQDAGEPGMRISDVRLETESGTSPAAAVARFGGGESVWLGWSVPAVPAGFRSCCCFDRGEARTCSLAEDEEGWSNSDEAPAVADPRIVVLARAERGEVRALRIVSPDCPVDGAGRRLVWLGPQATSASLDLLEGLLDRHGGRHDLGERALAALAAHDDARADSILERRAFDRALDENQRQQALFWAGNLRGAAGYRMLDRFLASERDGDLREHAVFALSQSPAPEADGRIRRAASEDRDSDVRSRALFWLAQSDAPGAGAWIVDRMHLETDAGVREQAVFALSQLDDGTDWLLRVLRSDRDPAIVRQALFWLGQSEDPRALDEIEHILAR